MDVLVTGGLGFVGSNLVERLVRDGHSVTVLDNGHTGKEDNLNSVKEKVKVFKKSAGQIAELGKKFDIVFHQGVYSSSPMYKDDRHLTSKALDEMISILEYAKENGSKVIFASSSSLYNGNAPPHREDMKIKVTDFYTEGRYAMERIADLYHQFYGVKAIGLRYFSIYGPHERSKGKYANLITQFLWSIQKNETPVIYGDGNQARDFVYVGDIVEANMCAMKSDVSFGVYNVGTGVSTTINDMFKMLSKKMGKDIKPRYIENKIKNYVPVTKADTKKAETGLGFMAKTGLSEGIDRIIEYYSK